MMQSSVAETLPFHPTMKTGGGDPYTGADMNKWEVLFRSAQSQSFIPFCWEGSTPGQKKQAAGELLLVEAMHSEGKNFYLQ